MCFHHSLLPQLLQEIRLDSTVTMRWMDESSPDGAVGALTNVSHIMLSHIGIAYPILTCLLSPLLPSKAASRWAPSLCCVSSPKKKQKWHAVAKSSLILHLMALLGGQNNAVVASETRILPPTRQGQLVSEPSSSLRGHSIERNAVSLTDASKDFMELLSAEDGPDSEIIARLGNNLNEIALNLAAGSSKSDEETLKASVNAVSLIKDVVSDLSLAPSMPSALQDIVKTVVNDLGVAKEHLENVETIVTKHLDASRPRRRVLSSKQDSTTKYYHGSGATKADYHMRSKSLHLDKHRGHHNFEHQQGYHRARASRYEGKTRRRLSEHSECK